jgi:hypothetical protein
LAVRDNRQWITLWRQEDLVATSVWAMGSSDTGTTWSAPVELSEGMAALQPAAALGPDGAAYFVWYDSPSGNQELYFRLAW